MSLANDQASPSIPSAQWQLAWSDEFNSKRGSAPNPSIWGNEVGDGTAYGIPGWGNDELEYYTTGGDNAATDGNGNLVITTKAADGSLQCSYGPCKYTSARLLTKNRFEVAYGRVEARVKVPRGAGLWPAFWMLGTDIDQVNWPQAGEIDIMEHVARLPNQVFGTLHGPGYSGGQSYGKVVDLGRPVADTFHTYAVEWQPDRIVWYLDGVPYFTATPSDAFMQGKEWVFNHPFYMLLNVAVGGNFGGSVDPGTVFPNQTLVDYVRLYQATPIPATFSASFTDSFTGWQKVTIPLSAFQGSGGRDAGSHRRPEPELRGAEGRARPDPPRPGAAGGRHAPQDADGPPGDLRLADRGLRPGGLRRGRGLDDRRGSGRRHQPGRQGGQVGHRRAVGRHDPHRGRHARLRQQGPLHRVGNDDDRAGLVARRRHPGPAQGGGRGGSDQVGRDRGDDHGRRLADADLQLRQPGGRARRR